MWEMCDNSHGNFFDYSGEMTRYGYLEIYTKIAKVMLPPADFVEVEIRAEAELDWKEDTEGRGADSDMRDVMSYSLFYESLFQLADIWSTSIHVSEYKFQLTRMLGAMTDAEGTCPSRSWKSTENIIPNQCWKRVQEYLKLEAAKEIHVGNTRVVLKPDARPRSPAPKPAHFDLESTTSLSENKDSTTSLSENKDSTTSLSENKDSTKRRTLVDFDKKAKQRRQANMLTFSQIAYLVSICLS